MDAIREFVEGLDALDRIGRRPWSGISAMVARVMDMAACCAGVGLVLSIIPALLASLALTLAFVGAALAGA